MEWILQNYTKKQLKEFLDDDSDDDDFETEYSGSMNEKVS